MFVLNRAGRWFAGLLEAFDEALAALDDDVTSPALGRLSPSRSQPVSEWG